MKVINKRTKKGLFDYYKNGPKNVPTFEKLDCGKFMCTSNFGIVLPNETENYLTKKCEMGLLETFEKLVDHLLNHHRVTNLFSCNVCQVMFIGKLNWQHHHTHACAKGGRKFQCLKCPSVFTSWTLLNSHLRSFHKMSTIFKCLYCNQFFFTKVMIIVTVY